MKRGGGGEKRGGMGAQWVEEMTVEGRMRDEEEKWRKKKQKKGRGGGGGIQTGWRREEGKGSSGGPSKAKRLRWRNEEREQRKIESRQQEGSDLI